MGTHCASEGNEEIPIEYTAAGAAIDRNEVVAEDDTVWVPLAHRRSRSASSS